MSTNSLEFMYGVVPKSDLDNLGALLALVNQINQLEESPKLQPQVEQQGSPTQPVGSAVCAVKAAHQEDSTSPQKGNVVPLQASEVITNSPRPPLVPKDDASPTRTTLSPSEKSQEQQPLVASPPAQSRPQAARPIKQKKPMVPPVALKEGSQGRSYEWAAAKSARGQPGKECVPQTLCDLQVVDIATGVISPRPTAGKVGIGIENSGAAVDEGSLRFLFNAYDTNGSGEIDREEFKAKYQGFENFGLPMTKREVDKLFDRYDKNRNGMLCFDEFCMLMLFRFKM